MIMNEIEIKSSKFYNANHLVIILHGYGNSGADYIQAIEKFFTNDLEDSVFILPDAPDPCDTWTGRQWFPLKLEGMTYEEIRHGLDETAPKLAEYINRKMALYNCTKISLIGISQGAFLALEMIYHANISFVISYCGLFARPEGKLPIQHPQILLIHSNNDKIVPYTYAQKAKTDLEELGLDVELKTYPNIGHSISTDGWKYGASALREFYQKR